MPNKKILFPRLERILVQNYEMYQGPDGKGLDWSFEPGVTVAVGINGLGKTTFLNALLYGFVGSKLLPKADQATLGVSKFQLIQPSRTTYFTERVTDYAKNATIELWFWLGSTRVYLKRKLSNLSILELKVGNTHVAGPDDERYLETMAEVSGLRNGYQFHVVIKYLSFFLEGYIPLLWDRESQFEILRILLLDDGLAEKLAALKQEIMKTDSQWRNIRAVLNHLEERHGDISEEDSKGADLQKLEAEFRVLEQQAKGVADLAADLERVRLEQFEKIYDLKEKKFRIDVEVAEAERHVRATHDHYLRTISPQMEDNVRVLLGQLLDGAGCALCGSRDETTRLLIERDLAEGHCPVCHSPKSAQEVRPVTPLKAAELKRRLGDLSEKRRVSSELLERINGETGAYEELQRKVQEVYRQQEDAQNVAERKRSQLPPQSDAERIARRRILENRTYLASLKGDLLKLQGEYTQLVREANSAIGQATMRIRRTFAQYAKQFLEEDVDLEYTTVKVPLGQEYRVMLPSFTVKMTSSVAISTPLERKTEGAVSESQREFLELAFRMALMTVATHRKDRGFLVMETPEASLDAIFIRRAGAMLRKFAASKGTRNGAQVIASSNISGAEMIKALLGDAQSERGKGERRKRVINMLEMAKPNAAYRKHRQEYDKLFAEATSL